MWVQPIFSQWWQHKEFHIPQERHVRYLRMPKERFDSLLAEVHCNTGIIIYNYKFSDVLTKICARIFNKSVPF